MLSRLHADAMYAVDACAPHSESELESELVSPPDVPAGPAVDCDDASVVEFGTVVERGTLGSTATDAIRTPPAGARRSVC